MQYGNAVTNAYLYDSLNRLTNLVWKHQTTTNASFSYQLKPGGTRTNLSEAVNGVSRIYSWSYDSLYRLTNEVVGGIGSVGYHYDAAGNQNYRTSSIVQLPSDSYSYNSNDEQIADDYGANGFSNGNTTSYAANGDSYSYDNLCRLSSQGSFSYFYDGDNNRIIKFTPAGIIWYMMDDRNPSGLPQVLE